MKSEDEVRLELAKLISIREMNEHERDNEILKVLIKQIKWVLK